MNDRLLPEYLVVLDGSEASNKTIRERARVVHIASPRLVIVRAAPDAAEALRQASGVSAVFEGNVSADMKAGFDEGEAMFAAAWELRRNAPPKQRKGDGLDWDHPGFEPPDPPPGAKPL